ncbi:methyltransferase-like protein 27 isoform X1 [Lingula anatina]|uniref:Methyltransferase-like protein 27 isoform X1 n=1 Tax=Lingula anatina TaxID=7574 RepID=A0A1S3JDX3_LINAN|nr:methyltransferase-like protein 27 isoform X1 [Lingula anatina]|eukprot:XP_013408371.1 methyltransferase-like protein 27 isoform X1 [Lingula anatina]
MAKIEEKMLPIYVELNRPGITTEEVEDVYARWVKDYDKDMADLNYFVSSNNAYVVEKALKHKNDALILDAACGTGLVGVELTKRGFHNLHGLDRSTAMLEQAKQKGIYKKMMCASLGPNRLGIPDDTYDAVVMSGAVGSGHVDGSCLEEFIRIVKPGGYVVMDTTLKFFHRVSYQGKSWDEIIDNHIMAGRWVTVTRRLVEQSFNSLDGIQYAFQVK